MAHRLWIVLVCAVIGCSPVAPSNQSAPTPPVVAKGTAAQPVETESVHQLGSRMVVARTTEVFLRDGAGRGAVKPNKPVRVALVAANRALRLPDVKAQQLWDHRRTELVEGGWSVVSRENLRDAMAELAIADLPKAPDGINQPEPDPFQDRDQMMRLATKLGVDAILRVQLRAIGSTRKVVDPPAGPAEYRHELRLVYHRFDGAGGTLTQGTLLLGTDVRTRSGEEPEDLEVLFEDLLIVGARELKARMLAARASAATVPAPSKFHIRCEVVDLVFPKIEKEAATGNWVIGAGTEPVEMESFEVSLDGESLGRATSHRGLYARGGLHKLRITHPLLEPRESTVNIKEGVPIALAVELNREGMMLFKEVGTMFNALPKRRYLTEAQVQMFARCRSNLRANGFIWRGGPDVKPTR